MLNVNLPRKIHVYASPADMRKGIDGLSGTIRGELGAEPTDGSLFVFINRRRDRMKILFFDGSGFWLYYRLLEAGTFEELKHTDQSRCVTIDATQLAMLLSGISLKAAERRRKRYSSSKSKDAA